MILCYRPICFPGGPRCRRLDEIFYPKRAKDQQHDHDRKIRQVPLESESDGETGGHASQDQDQYGSDDFQAVRGRKIHDRKNAPEADVGEV